MYSALQLQVCLGLINARCYLQIGDLVQIGDLNLTLTLSLTLTLPDLNLSIFPSIPCLVSGETARYSYRGRHS